jgi:hypothetical protein
MPKKTGEKFALVRGSDFKKRKISFLSVKIKFLKRKNLFFKA